MRTLYIDVYFLINFTVDVLSLYFATMFSKTPSSGKRLIFSGLLGAVVAVIVVFLPEIPILKFVIATIALFVIGFIAPKPIKFKRRLKFIFAFLIFEALTGGAVTFIWSLLDKYGRPIFEGTTGGAVNRKMLFLSLILLLSIGVFKMLVSLFSSNETEHSVDIEITFLNNKTLISAFVDSGNLAVDPMDMSPVLFIKEEIAKTILPKNIINLSDIDALDRNVKKRIRLVPVTRDGATHMLIGVKADAVRVVSGESNEEIKVTLVIDREGGSFGGFSALMPSAALDNVNL